MKKNWMTAYPRQGQWYHIQNLIDIVEVYQYALSHLISHKMKAISICKKDIRKWFLNSTEEIETFYWYLKNNISTDDLKLRMFAKEK